MALDAAPRLAEFGALDAAARRGELSAFQVAPIAEAAAADPRAERRLVTTARTASLGELLDECARTRAAAEPDPEAWHKALHESRFLRRRRCADGAGELRYRSTPEEVTEVWSVVAGYAQQAFERARAEGRCEREEVHLADGLLATARAAAAGNHSGDRPVRATKVVVRVDWDALVRGWPVDDEVCELAGVGPVPVSVVKGMVESGDSFLAAVVTRGVDICSVAHMGRRPNAHQTTALEWLSPVCTVAGCNTSVRLEADHRREWSRSKVTLLDLLDRLCAHHHHLKSHRAWALVAGTGKRPMVPPWDPRHPRHAEGSAGDARAGPDPAAVSVPSGVS